MAGLFFWRKKREAPADVPANESAPEESVAPAPVEPEKPKDKKPRFFKPKPKPEPEAPAAEPAPEPAPEPAVTTHEDVAPTHVEEASEC